MRAWPGWHQDITLAECWAFWAYVVHVGPAGGVFYTDCQNLHKAFVRGAAHCTDALSIYSGIWRKIWAKIHDIGVDLIQVVWVPAHLSESKARDRDLAEWQRQGNNWADQLAKEGAAKHEGLDDLKAIALLTDQRTHFVQWLARFVVAIHLWMMKHQFQDFKWPAREKQADFAPGSLLVMRIPPGCRQRRKRKQHRSLDRSHALRRNGDLVWCGRCGCWAQSRVFLLAGWCQPDRLQNHVIFRKRIDMLRSGRHPVSRKPLPPPSASWVGSLLDRDAADDLRQRGPEVERTTPLCRPFLSRRRHDDEMALDIWLAAFGRLFPYVGARATKSKGMDEPEEEG